MNQDKVFQEFSALPLQAQQMVADFIVFLKNRYPQMYSSLELSSDLRNDEFVGMWRDREDMADSVNWVRQLRQSEWG